MSCTLWTLGDALAQHIERKADQRKDFSEWYDSARTKRMALMGLIWSGPAMSVWYHWLHLRTLQYAHNKAKMVAIKCVYDQFILEPPWLSLNFCIIGALDGKGLEAIRQKFTNVWLETYILVIIFTLWMYSRGWI